MVRLAAVWALVRSAAIDLAARRIRAYITGHTIVVDGGQTLGIPGSLEDAAG